MSVEEVLRTMSVEDAGYGDFSKLDSDEDKGKQFQDLVIKFSNLRTLLEPGAGRFGETAQNDIRHKIAKTDYAVIIGVSTQDNLPLDSVGKAPENDATVMSDICRLHLGMKPSRVKLLTSHRKRPTRENIRKAVKDALKNTKREDMVLIYYSGHGHTVQDEHYLVPQDFRMEDTHGTGISARHFYKWFSKSDCRRIVLILDCCYAEKFTEAFYRVRGDQEMDKHLYLLASSEMSQPSVSDESWLEYGYMTFFIKHYFNFVCAPVHQVSMLGLTRFIKKYAVPLSRFTYTVEDKQVEQRPVLAHLGPDGEVETDASYYDQIDPGLVEYWSGRIRKSYAYQSWWYDRMKDAKVLLSEPTFSYSRLYFAIFLNGLSSICILLCERDSFQKELDTHEQFNSFALALEQLVTRDLEGVTHSEFERYVVGEGVCDPRSVIQGGVSEGIRSVSQPSAPPETFVCTVNSTF